MRLARNIVYGFSVVAEQEGPTLLPGPPPKSLLAEGHGAALEVHADVGIKQPVLIYSATGARESGFAISDTTA